MAKNQQDIYLVDLTRGELNSIVAAMYYAYDGFKGTQIGGRFDELSTKLIKMRAEQDDMPSMAHGMQSYLLKDQAE